MRPPPISPDYNFWILFWGRGNQLYKYLAFFLKNVKSLIHYPQENYLYPARKSKKARHNVSCHMVLRYYTWRMWRSVEHCWFLSNLMRKRNKGMRWMILQQYKNTFSIAVKYTHIITDSFLIKKLYNTSRSDNFVDRVGYEL